MIRSNQIQARSYSSKADLFRRQQGADPFGKKVNSFEFMGTIPCSINDLSGYRALQYEQVGIINSVEVRMRKPGFDFDRMFIHREGHSFIPGQVLSNTMPNKLNEITIHSRINYDATNVGDEVVITGGRKDE